MRMNNTLQIELNHRIAVCLDKHCIQNEYGRLLIDRDKQTRRELKWILNISTPMWIELAVSILAAIIGAVSDVKWLLFIGCFLCFCFIIYFSIRFYYRNKISLLLADDEKDKANKLLYRHHELLSKLQVWFMEVGKDKSTTKKKLDLIEQQFPEVVKEADNLYNELSDFFGLLEPALDIRARKNATAKLEQLLQFYFN